MSYQQALEKAWNAVSGLSHDSNTAAVKLLADTYTIDLKARAIFSDSCNVPAKEYVSILLLHYLKRTKEAGNLPPLTGEWIDFNEIEGGEGYYAAFRKRTIDRILKKYGSEPVAIKRTLDRLPGELSDKGDVSIIIHPFNEIAILITLSKADDEFGPDANILFDKNISGIFCTEDIVVLTEMVVHSL
jgi:hypothetical protein